MPGRTRTFYSTSAIAGVLGLVSMFAPHVARAQTEAAGAAQTSEEILVIAERRVGTAQKTGAAVSVRDGDDLLEEGKFSLDSILENIPGITGGAATSSAGTLGGGTDSPASGLVIRGIPSNVGAGGSTTPPAAAAAIYVDGVYGGIGGGYDIERIEVLRGPQGTLYGRSATSGLVAIHTRNPDLDSFGGNALIEAGNYDLLHFSGALNLPIVTDKLAVRVAGNRYERDGFINGDDGSTSSNDAKIKLLFEPNDRISLLVGAALQDNVIHSGGRQIAASPDPDQVVYSNIPTGEVKTKFRQYWADLNVDLGFATLSYQPSFREWTQAGVLYADSPLGIISQPITTPKDHFMIHELRLSSNPESKLIWQVGAIYYDNELVSTNTSIFNGVMGFSSDETRDTTAYGVFGQMTYPVTDTVRATVGVRYDRTKVQATNVYQLGAFIVGPGPLPPPFVLSGPAGERTFNNFTYKVRLEHDLSPRNLLYGSVSTGFSPGDVVVAASCPPEISPVPPCALELEAETLTSYEIGSKNRFLDGDLQLNAAVFYSKYGAYQSGGINVNLLPGPPSFAPLSSPMESYGVELESYYRITAVDRLDLNFSWVRSRYVDKPPLFALFVAEDEVTDNNAPGSVAPIPVSASLAYQHIFVLPGDSTLSLRGEVLYSSSHGGHLNAVAQANGLAPFVHIDSAVTGNASATWRINDTFSLSAYVRNVTDHRYFDKVTLDSSLGFPSYQQRYNDPRTYGVVLHANF